jgi:hypothetical protein
LIKYSTPAKCWEPQAQSAIKPNQPSQRETDGSTAEWTFRIGFSNINPNAEDLQYGDNPTVPKGLNSLVDEYSTYNDYANIGPDFKFPERPTHLEFNVADALKKGTLLPPLFDSSIGIKLFNHFLNGEGTELLWQPTSSLSQSILKTDMFLNFFNKFRLKVLKLKIKRAEIYDNDDRIKQQFEDALRNTWKNTSIYFTVENTPGLNAAIGGVQGVYIDIKLTAGIRVEVELAIELLDVFGVSFGDVSKNFLSKNLPGLSEMYVLQHYINVMGPYTKLYHPYIQKIRLATTRISNI